MTKKLITILNNLTKEYQKKINFYRNIAWFFLVLCIFDVSLIQLFGIYDDFTAVIGVILGLMAILLFGIVIVETSAKQRIAKEVMGELKNEINTKTNNKRKS